MSETNPIDSNLVVATRIHLGKATAPTDQSKMDSDIEAFLRFATSCGAGSASIAVDATPKFPNYNLVDSIQQASLKVQNCIPCRIVPVCPWGEFVPALNALVSDAAMHRSRLILFCSKETTASPKSIQTLCGHLDEKTLVAGALLPGHEYSEGQTVDLTGRTTPWNTLAVWSVSMLALNGFSLVSEGLHPNNDESKGASGVEEAAAIAVLQKVLGHDNAVAKLVKLPDIKWEQEWQDEGRRQWHETKMNSKTARAARQLELLCLNGKVQHR